MSSYVPPWQGRAHAGSTRPTPEPRSRRTSAGTRSCAASGPPLPQPYSPHHQANCRTGPGPSRLPRSPRGPRLLGPARSRAGRARGGSARSRQRPRIAWTTRKPARAKKGKYVVVLLIACFAGAIAVLYAADLVLRARARARRRSAMSERLAAATARAEEQHQRRQAAAHASRELTALDPRDQAATAERARRAAAGRRIAGRRIARRLAARWCPSRRSRFVVTVSGRSGRHREAVTAATQAEARHPLMTQAIAADQDRATREHAAAWRRVRARALSSRASAGAAARVAALKPGAGRGPASRMAAWRPRRAPRGRLRPPPASVWRTGMKYLG